MGTTQSKENSLIETRPFVAFYEALSATEQEVLRAALVEKLKVSRQAVWGWATGRRPKNMDLRKKVCRVIKNELNITTEPRTLFPVQ